MKSDVCKILCFSEMSLPRTDIFPELIVLTSLHELSADPIPRIFEVTLQVKKPSTLVDGKKVFMMPHMTTTITDIFTTPY